MKQIKKIFANPIVSWALKLSIAIISFGFIYREVVQKDNFHTIVKEFRLLLTSGGAWMICFIMALMVINWGLEAIKWKWMIRKIEYISFRKSFVAVLSGLTVSFFTPNRIGEYVGRIFHLKSSDRIQATLITILENFSQLVITIIAGAIALIFYLDIYVEIDLYLKYTVAIIIIIFLTLLLFIFFQVPVLDASILKRKYMQKLKKYFQVLVLYSTRELLMLLLLALGRFLIFTWQFFLLLRLFEVQSAYLETMILISMVFLVMAIIPTFALTELGVRGAVATWFLSRITYDNLAIINSTFSLWLINIVIPSLIGAIFVLGFRFYKQPA